MKRTKGRGRQTVTFPFQIAIKDILAADGMEVTFRGTVYPDRASGYAPVPFRSTVSITAPKIPRVAFEDAEGVLLGDSSTVRIKVNNINAIDSYLKINQVRYQLLHTEKETKLEPDTWKTVALRMENTPNKTLSMVLNTLLSPEARSLCGRPYGWVIILIDVKGGKR